MNCGKKYRAAEAALIITIISFVLIAWSDRMAWGAGMESGGISIPNINISVGGSGGTGGTAMTVQILFLLTILSLAPAIIVMVTSFTRIAVVLSLLRQAMGTQQIPPNQV